MQRYIALLRGINVGGHRVSMTNLRQHFAELGFANVATFIASGNLIFDAAEGDAGQLETTIAGHLHWQRTHYGFQRDNGHFFFTSVHGDFTLRAELYSAPNAQYDQCGLLARASAATWVKCAAEYETATHSRLGSVVTNHGYSDWATQDVAGAVTRLWYRLRRAGDDIFVDWAADGADWRQMRIAHLQACPAELQVGVYACSPTGAGFTCRVTHLEIEVADRDAR